MATRQYVSLNAEFWNPKTVDHVLRDHGQADITIHGDMQCVDFALAIFVLGFPHPLLGHHIDLQRILGGSGFSHIDVGSPDEENHEDAEGNDDPGKFERKRAGHLFCYGMLTVPVTEYKDQHDGADE